MLRCLFSLIFFIALASYVVSVPTWINVDSAFGPYTRPFRYGHAAVCTNYGRITTFSGVSETAVASPALDRFNYLSDGTILTLQNLPTLDNNARVISAYGIWQSNYLVTYGGYLGSGITAEPRLLIYDTSAGVWLNSTEYFTPNTAPGADNEQNHWVFQSYGASMQIDDNTNKMYLFGGNAISYQLNFVTEVDLMTQEFNQLYLANQSIQSPNRKYGAAMALSHTSGDKLWMFGGKAGLGAEGTVQQSPAIYNEMSLFDLSINAWLNVPSVALANLPSARAFMSSVVLSDGITWIIFGGRNDYNLPITSQIMYNDIYSFDLNTQSWSSYATTGTPPSQRDKAPGMLLDWVGEDSILIYGGSDQGFSPLNDFWYLKITSTGSPPISPPSSLDLGNDGNGDVVILPSASPTPGITPSTSPVPPSLSSGQRIFSWLSWVLC